VSLTDSSPLTVLCSYPKSYSFENCLINSSTPHRVMKDRMSISMIIWENHSLMNGYLLLFHTLSVLNVPKISFLCNTTLSSPPSVQVAQMPEKLGGIKRNPKI
jgi:hypothetical protein